MSSADEALNRIDTVVQVGMRIASSLPSGRIALAKAADVIDPEWIPRKWQHVIWPELERAREAALYEPVDARTVERILREAWGAPPTEELDELDTEPTALTPTSQVHRALLDGAPVAVKVLRPGLSAGVRQDLALIEGIAGPMQSAFPEVDVAGVLAEIRERVLDELDLEHEASMQRRFHRALRGHPHLVVPAPITRLAAEQVLVSEWIDGRPLPEAEDGDLVAARLIGFALGGLRAGLAHADPDARDVLELDEERIAILDYGASRVVEPQHADAALKLVEAFAADDAAGFGKAFEALGTLPASQGERALSVARHAFGELGEPGVRRLDPAAVLGIGRRLTGRREDVLELVLGGALPPQDIWPVRGIGQAFAAAARAGTSADWLQIVLSALREGWDAVG